MNSDVNTIGISTLIVPLEILLKRWGVSFQVINNTYSQALLLLGLFTAGYQNNAVKKYRNPCLVWLLIRFVVGVIVLPQVQFFD